MRIIGLSIALVALSFVGCTSKPKTVTKPWAITTTDTLTTESGLKYLVVQKSTNPVQAQKGKVVDVHYTGFLLDGKVFDSSVDRGEPFRFAIGQNMVIPGWEEGIALMHVGDKFRFIIPSELGYGGDGAGKVIPPDATLIFDVELVGVK